MAKIARTEDDGLFCSNCSSSVKEGDEVCPACEETLEGEFEAKVCPSCGGLIESDVESCPICGEEFEVKVDGDFVPDPKAKDEDFLVKLLEWGQKRKEDVETVEDMKEKEQAAGVFMKMRTTGMKTTEERLTDLEPVEDVKSKGDKPLGVDKPLETAINNRHNLIEQLKDKFEKSRDKIEEMKKTEDSEKIVEQVEEDLKFFENEINRLEKIEMAVENLRQTYTSLIISQRDELEKKERDFNLRLSAFKKELSRRVAEKKALEEEKVQVEERERDVEKRLKNLENREELIIKKEERLKEQIEKVRASKTEEGDDETTKEGPIERLSKEEWKEEQKKIQNELLGLHNQSQKSEKERGMLIDELETLKLEKERLEKKIEDSLHLDGEVIEIIKLMDDLLEDLPEDKIKAFANSEEFELYEKVLDKLGI